MRRLTLPPNDHVAAWRVEPARSGRGGVRLRVAGTLHRHLFVDGGHLARGPVAFHPGEVPVEEFPLHAAGAVTLAVEAWDPGLPTLSRVPAGEPWLGLALLDGDDRDLLEGASFFRAPDAGFCAGTPRRTPVLGPVELFDAEAGPPPGWRDPGFDPAGWNVERPGAVAEGPAWLPRPVPPLRSREVLAAGPLHAFAADAPVEPLNKADAEPGGDPLAVTGAYAAALEAATGGRLGGPATAGGPRVHTGPPCVVEGLTPERGVQLVFDLGAEWVGEPLLTLHSDTPGTADLGFAESLHPDGRPRLIMKGGSYANRVRALAGQTAYAGLGHSGFRYLSVMLRGFTGSVRIEKLGVRAHEAELAWPGPGDVRAPTPGLQPAVDLSVRTLRLGVQETLLDCPTREQAMYTGDAHPMARWLFRLTGDATHWRRLVTAQFARPARTGPFEGLVRTVVFSAFPQMLLDYELVALSGTADYLRHTGDVETVRAVLPAARGVYGWFERRMDAAGWCGVVDAELPRGGPPEARFDPDAVDAARNARLFIDHAGIGWHNVGEPGIDRRGVNAALQAYLCVAERALAELEDAAGDCGRAGRAAALRARAEARAEAAGARFFDAGRNAFVDGELDGRKLTQVSQQTNVWAALGGWFGRGGVPDAAAVLGPLFADPPAGAATCGPYFWVYAVPALRAAGLEGLVRREVQRLWQPMIDAGATSLWESFAGDDLDSRCHPWSGAPIDVALGPWEGAAGRSRSEQP